MEPPPKDHTLAGPRSPHSDVGDGDHGHDVDPLTSKVIASLWDVLF